MRSTLEIDSGMAAKLQSLANARNISVEDLLNACVPGLTPNVKINGVRPEEAVRALDEWIAAFPDTPPLSDEAISRSSIYGDR